MNCAVSAQVRLIVPFHDVDIMRVVWHGHYLKYFDQARQALFVRQGLNLFDGKEPKGWVFPVIRSEVKHIHPLQLGDEFLCTATLREARVMIVLDFEILRIRDGKVCARGRSEQAAVRLPEMEMAFSIPEEVRNTLCTQNAEGTALGSGGH
ncbi:MAG: acyl-CoA thioesterase [Deltaproteobacteria bacterium]|nr:acyl-CoA thioesterase [Deltaproteobacteria bacterium]